MPARGRTPTKSPQRSRSPPSYAQPTARGRASSATPRAQSTPPEEVPPAHELAAVFRRLDARGRGALSIADVDRAVAALYGGHGNAYRPALQRAFHAADAAGGGALGLAEFCLFFEYLVYFRGNWATFEQIERACGDGLTLDSLMAACKQLGQPLQRMQALTAFQMMAGSTALGGRVTMDNFCRWSAQWHIERGAELATANQARAAKSSIRPAAQALEIEIEVDSTSVHTFGKNSSGQLGLGHWRTCQRSPDAPVRLPRIDPAPTVPRLVKKVACGGRHTVILSTSGELWSYGSNDHGQLGMGISQPKTTRAVGMHASASSSYTTPQRVRGTTSMLRTGVRDIACGEAFSMLVDGEGAIWGWGDNRRGQLGHPTLHRVALGRAHGAGSMNNALIPTKLDDTGAGPLPPVRTLAVGHSHVVAISQQGGLWSWGWNEYGQLGLEHMDPFHFVPQQVQGLLASKSCTAVACGERHTVVVAFDASSNAGADRNTNLAYSFGNNSSGQLGTGKEKGAMGFVENVPTPQHVLFNPDLEHGLHMTSHVQNRPRSRSPAAVRRRAQESGQEKGAYLGGGDYGDGGPRPNMQRLGDHPSELGLSVVRLACGARHTLAVVEHIRGSGGRRQSGELSVWSWGQNNKGQLGLAANEGVSAKGGCGTMSIPHRVAAMDHVSDGDLSGAEVSCGDYTSYVAHRGAVHAWGNNHAGQLGVSTETHDTIHLITKKQKDTDIVREISLADFSGPGQDPASTHRLMCVAAGGDHAAIWVDMSSSAVIADDSRATAPRRFEDCSLPKKCEIAVMGHDPVLLADCITQVVRDRSTATMEKPLRQRIEHLQDAWDGPNPAAPAAGGVRDETFLHSLEAAQAAAAAAVEAETPPPPKSSSSVSQSPARSSRSRSPGPRSTPPGVSPARSTSTQRRQSSRQSVTPRRAAPPAMPKMAPLPVAPVLPPVRPASPVSAAAPPSGIDRERLRVLEGDVAGVKKEVAGMRSDIEGLKCEPLQPLLQMPMRPLLYLICNVSVALRRSSVDAMAGQITLAIQAMTRNSAV